MDDTAFITQTNDLSEVYEHIKNSQPFEFVLKEPSPKSRQFIKDVTNEYLKVINKEQSYNLLCLCIEEIISNSVKANVKRAYFISNHLDINNHEDYKKGMENFKEAGVGNIKDKSFVEHINKLGLYVKMTFKVVDDILYISTRNNSVISNEELERIEKKLKLSENKTPEEIFMNSIDLTEGAGLGIIMIKKIMSQISPAKDCFSIRATETETVTELKIVK